MAKGALGRQTEVAFQDMSDFLEASWELEQICYIIGLPEIAF